MSTASGGGGGGGASSSKRRRASSSSASIDCTAETEGGVFSTSVKKEEKEDEEEKGEEDASLPSDESVVDGRPPVKRRRTAAATTATREKSEPSSGSSSSSIESGENSLESSGASSSSSSPARPSKRSRSGAHDSESPTDGGATNPRKKKRRGRVSSDEWAEREATARAVVGALLQQSGASRRQNNKPPPPPLLDALPPELVRNCLSHLCASEDHYSLQVTCSFFQSFTSTPIMLRKLDLLGCWATGNGSLLGMNDTSSEAREKLIPYALAGNPDAIYALGLIACYADDELPSGLRLLRCAASTLNDARAAHELGLLLRKKRTEESRYFLDKAANMGHLPSMLELRRDPCSSSDFRGKKKRKFLRAVRGSVVPRAVLSIYRRATLRGSGGVMTSVADKRWCWNPACLRPTFRWNRRVNKRLKRIGALNRHAEKHGRGVALWAYVQRYGENLPENGGIAERSLRWRELAERVRGAVEGIGPDNDDPEKKPAAAATSSSSSPSSSSAPASRNPPPGESSPSYDEIYRVPALWRCARCLEAAYCGRSCQLLHWNEGHRERCRPPHLEEGGEEEGEEEDDFDEEVDEVENGGWVEEEGEGEVQQQEEAGE